MPSFHLLSRSALFISVLFLSSALAAGAAESIAPVTPTSLKGGEVISHVAAKQLLDQGRTEFFDLRSAGEFGSGHIPSAKQLSYVEKSGRTIDFDPSVDKFDVGKLPPNKGATVVFYCVGADGWTSYKAAVLAIRAGHRDVRWLREGFSGWKDAQYPVE